MAIDVNTIQRSSGRAAPHMPQECLVTALPFLAHSYSTSTIDRIFLVVLVQASGLCVAPSLVLFGYPATFVAFIVCLAMLFTDEAAATSDSFARKMSRSYVSQLTAVTEAIPANKRTKMRSLIQDDKLSESYSCKNYFSHN